MKTIVYFLLGVVEFRDTVTTDAGKWQHAYDAGRALAHKLTFRRFEP